MRIEIDIPDEIAGQLPADEEARDIAIIEGVQLWLDVKDDAPSPERVREILLDGVAQYRVKLESEQELCIWLVFDGEVTHDVVASSAIDAMRVLADQWGDEQWDEYLETPGVTVKRLTETQARAMRVTDEDGTHESDLWAEAHVGGMRRGYLGASEV